MRRLVYGYLWVDNEDAKYSLDALRDMARIWADSIRAAGRYDDDIALISNVPDAVALSGVKALQFDQEGLPLDNNRSILGWKNIPYQHYDQLLKLDLDIIAVNDIAPLFATNASLWTAPSNMRTLDPRHALTFAGGPVKRLMLRFSNRWQELGVSSSVYSARGDCFADHLSAWSDTILRLRNRAPKRRLNDQMYLNCMHWSRTVPIEQFSTAQVQHRKWTWSPEAVLFHFPNSDRLKKMERYSQADALH